MGLLFLSSILKKENSYNKQEKLKSRTLINDLFNKGKSFHFFPLKMLYQIGEKKDQPLQAGVTLSSRNFKKAVDRNRIKRVIRECYRLQKKSLENALLKKEASVVIFFIYTSKEMPDYTIVHDKMQLLLQKIEELILGKTEIE